MFGKHAPSDLLRVVSRCWQGNSEAYESGHFADDILDWTVVSSFV